MEETKLDKFVGKIFDGTEKFTHFIASFVGRYLNSPYFWLIQIIIGILIIVLALDKLWSSEIIDFSKLSVFFMHVVFGLSFIHAGATAIYREINDIDLKILKFSRKFYSEETIKFCFEPLIADWKVEYSKAILQDRKWRAFEISLRYFFAFFAAIFQQSRLGRLIEIIFKQTK
jgi:hypothetical protein